MAQTLGAFVEEQHSTLVEFKDWWEKKNAQNPALFPMEMPNGNDGLWFEMLTNFVESGGKNANEGFYDF